MCAGKLKMLSYLVQLLGSYVTGVVRGPSHFFSVLLGSKFGSGCQIKGGSIYTTSIKHVQWGQAFRNSRTSARHWLHPRRTAKGSKSNSTSSTEGSKQGYRNMKQGLQGQQHQLTKRTYISHLTVKAITVGRGEINE